MATQTIEFRSPPSQTITAKLFAVGSDTQVASVSTTEATNRKGTYAAAYTNVPAGEYELIALVSTTPVARWFVTLTLTTATFQVYDKSQTVLMVADVMNASALAADAVAEIQSGLATPTNITAITGNITGNLSGSVGSVTGTVGSVTGAVGSVTAAVTVGTINANVVNASALAADAVAEIQSGLSTLTQTQVTGGAYAINNASFAFNAGLDFTTTMKAATLARVTLVDTTTTNTDMRGTDNAALAATALSTTQWTNTLATNIGTTNTTVATNLDATVSSRLASASYTTPPTAAGNASAVRTELTAELADIVSMDGRLPAALVSGFMSSALGDTDHGGSAATLSLSTIEIEPDSANTPGVFIRGTGSGAAVDVKGGENADGIKARSGDTSGYGICSNGVEGGARFWSTNGYGVRVSSDNNNAFSVYGGVYAFQINSLNNAIDIYSSTGNAVYLQSNSNDAVVIYPGADDVGVHIWGGQTSGDAVALSSNGTGSVFYPVDLSGLNNLSAAEVNAEVLDVMNVDTFAELAAPPAATSSLRDKLTWLFMWARNKSTQTSTQRKLFADDTTTIVGTEGVSDNGTTFTKNEVS